MNLGQLIGRLYLEDADAEVKKPVFAPAGPIEPHGPAPYGQKQVAVLRLLARSAVAMSGEEIIERIECSRKYGFYILQRMTAQGRILREGDDRHYVYRAVVAHE